MVTSVHGDHEESLCLAVRAEQDAPVAHSRFADTGAFGKRRREPGIKGVFGELEEAGADALLCRAVQAIEGFDAPFRNIGQPAIERGNRRGGQRRAASISGIAEVFEPNKASLG